MNIQDALENAQGCEHTDENKLYLHSSCHSGSPTWAFIDKEKHIIVIECAECRKTIVKLNLEKPS